MAIWVRVELADRFGKETGEARVLGPLDTISIADGHVYWGDIPSRALARLDFNRVPGARQRTYDFNGETAGSIHVATGDRNPWPECRVVRPTH